MIETHSQKAPERQRDIIRIARHMPTPREQIMDFVYDAATAHGVSVEAVFSRNSKAEISAARNAIYATLHRDKGWSLNRIGRLFGRHYTTIMAGVRQFEGRPRRG